MLTWLCALLLLPLLLQDFGNSIKSTIHWRCLVLDEGHKVKNEDSLVSQVSRD